MAEGKGPSEDQVSVGQYLAHRLVEVGVRDFFTVPGDFNMVLLDEMLKNAGLTFIGCCNELNAGYAADGYARGSGKLGVVVVTFMVGALSLINAVAGAFSDDLPLLVVVGSPNTNDLVERHVVHHSLGSGSLDQCRRAFDPVVTHAFSVHSPKDASGMIDNAVLLALMRRKPVYLEIACNVAHLPTVTPSPAPNLHDILELRSERTALAQAVQSIKSKVDEARDVVVVVGSKVNSPELTSAVEGLIETLGCAVAVMPDAKSSVCETDKNYVGCYWGEVSTGHAQEIVESAELVILIGPILNDYTTVGWTTQLTTESSLIIATDHVHLNKTRFSYVSMNEILVQLSKNLPKREQSFLKFEELRTRKSHSKSPQQTEGLRLRFIQDSLQENISHFSNIVVDTGDSWFLGQSLTLEKHSKFHLQMQYGSIGWSLPAMLGISLHSKRLRRSKDLLIIGDGAFQVTCQELSTMIRQNLDVIVLVINNELYTIEQQIHSGPYNELVSWDYSSLVNCFKGNSPTATGFKIKTCEELSKALDFVINHAGVSVLECCIPKDECSTELKVWGERVARANCRN